jgi:hypothetical protein
MKMALSGRLLSCAIGSQRHFSSQQNPSRRKLLEAVYFPAFKNLKKDSPEYNAIARSGKVWEDFFKPQDVEPYLLAQAKLRKTLERVDKEKLFLRTDSIKAITRALAKEYAHQSTALEGNPLHVGDALKIEDELEKKFFCTMNDLKSLRCQDLACLTLPSPDALLPGKVPVAVAELRNHIVVSRYLTEVGLANPSTTGVSLAEIKQLSRIMLAGTDAEDLYSFRWGKRVALGDFRAAPIAVRSNPMRIFPYHPEVPSCMERFIKWRDDCNAASQLHPLILATHLFVYFCHIHPFLNGNGRVGRSLMADFMVRQGYLPVVFRDMDRTDYLKMVSDAQDGKPEELCEAVAFTQWEMLFTVNLRQ